MRIQDDIQLDYCDVLLRPKRSALSSRAQVDIERQYSFKWCPRTIKATGIIAANMSTTGTMEIAREMQKHNLFTALHKFYTPKEIIAFLKENKKKYKNNDLIFISTGVSDADFKNLKTVMASKLAVNICIDVANGYSPYLINFIKKVREAYPKTLIMAGNVVTGDMTEDLILNGVDIVKVGIGPGSVCTTRRLTGVGRPQLSTVMECSDAAHGVGGMICADGGCTVPGDVCKSFCGGADFLMLGGMLAGHEESGGDLISKIYRTQQVELIDDKNFAPVLQEKLFKQFYGMSSEYAQDLFFGGMKKYRASEGKLVEVPYRGNIENTIFDILGGIRSAMTYIGAKRIKDMPKCATFYRVNRQLNNVFGTE